jgi:tetratricopeptide (TPR) repeat protein
MTLYNRAMCLMKIGKDEEALNDFDDCILAKPNYQKAYIQKSKIYQSKGADKQNIQNAIQSYGNAIQISKEAKTNIQIDSVNEKLVSLEELYFDRGCLYNQIGDSENAVNDFTNSIGANKNFLEAYYNRGVIHQEKCDFENAINDYDHFLSEKPNDVIVMFNRAITKHHLKKTDECIKELEEILQLDPDHQLAEKIYRQLTGEVEEEGEEDE